MRQILQVHAAVREDINDLVTYRAVPTASVRMNQLDPFLFLNHHGPQTYAPGNRGLPFGPHPHRGFETVTVILKGTLEHQDSGGFKSRIDAGGVQWMTAGSGVIHSELSPDSFLRDGGELEILQLWVNLPSRLKMTPPNYVGLQKNQIPALNMDNGKVTVHLVSGRWEQTVAPIQSLTDIHLSVLSFASGGKVERTVPSDRAVFFYVVNGKLAVNGEKVSSRDLLEFGAQGEKIAIAAESEAVVLFGHGQPYREPIAAHGPFVMNHNSEIIQAIEDYRQGKMGQWDK